MFDRRPCVPALSELPDWIRLQKALSIETERGFGDLVGREYRFSEFLCLQFGKPPAGLAASDRRRWRETAEQFAAYPNLDAAQRQRLVVATRQFLHQVQRACEGAIASAQDTSDLPKRPPKRPKTQDLQQFHPPDRALALDLPLGQVRAIGKRSGERLAKLGLLTVQDLLCHYPRDYIDYARQVNIRDLEAGETVTIVGQVKRCNCFTSPKNPKLTIFELILRDRTGQIRISKFFAGARFASVSWQKGQQRLYSPGALVAASGLVKQDKYGVSLDNPDLEVLDDAQGTIASLTVGRVVPVYPLTEGVTADLVRRSVLAVLPAAKQMPEALPRDFRDRYNLLQVSEAIAQVHFPEDDDQLAAARRRLIFDEFFYLQLGLLQRRSHYKRQETSVRVSATGPLLDRFTQALPFELTGAQKRVVQEILADLNQPTPMNRLVQGDVGSGKTVVAVIAILAAIQTGYQAALMAPTEVLSEQHYRKIVGWFNLLHLPVELLTGSTGAKKRRQIHAELQTGELPLLVGTHALIQDKVEFSRLGLVVIDEQHRFGVQQRAKLQQKGLEPHVLTMTATPIPRTLALTIHGDLDVSQIDELPPGRQAIQTTVLRSGDRLDAYDLMRREIAQGRQVYIVLPLVEESEKLDLKSAIEEYKRLSETVFPEFQVGLLHGRMSSAEKDEAIEQFRQNQTQILVSTTVIEVGVDVPNATVMMVEHSERFGLSQLHQLRGRVGRGAAQSFCLLMNTSKNPEAAQRLQVMAQSQDGFFISEMDMRFRGPGEVLGTRQSGLPDFALASLVDDRDVLELARTAAEDLINTDPELTEYPRIAAELTYRYRKLMGSLILT
ncbi:MAG: ATP-dependent DNA helicase RecG [Oscillatoriales cyanobacterium]|nr:MAG: ATP-dependent DNA helicase RecG [Oscillatoriales cyanobacterium]